jgi:hypothetical protein
MHGAAQPVDIPHVADKITQAGMVEPAIRISCCFSSSRLKMITFCGWYSSSMMRVNFFPNEPVPPVIKTTLFLQSICCSCGL